MASKSATASKSAAKAKAKAPPPKKPAPKVAAKAAPAKAAPAKVPPKAATAPGAKMPPGTPKAPVSNVEAIKAVAIKAAAKGAVPAPQPADKEAETTQDSPLLDLSDAGDEHGKLALPPGTKISAGDKLELIPSHCDTTVNLYDQYVCVRGGK